MLQVVPSEISHVYALAKSLRPLDLAEVLAICPSVRKAVRGAFRASYWCQTALVDGEVGAVCGMTGPLLSDTANVWLLTTPAVERAPLAYVKASRRCVDEMLAIKPRLEGMVAANYPQALGFMRLMGFTIHDPEPRGWRGDLFHPITLER